MDGASYFRSEQDTVVIGQESMGMFWSRGILSSTVDNTGTIEKNQSTQDKQHTRHFPINVQVYIVEPYFPYETKNI
jgi:hypothetical protein